MNIRFYLEMLSIAKKMTKQTLTFSRKDSAKFFRTLNKRVNQYFKENNLKKTGNWKLYFKALIMFSLLFGPLAILLIYDLPTYLQITCMMIIGVGMAGVGMNVMHDANHGSFSSKKWVNTIMGSSIHILPPRRRLSRTTTGSACGP